MSTTGDKRRSPYEFDSTSPGLDLDEAERLCRHIWRGPWMVKSETHVVSAENYVAASQVPPQIAPFIAFARTFVPEAVKELRALREENAALRLRIEDLEDSLCASCAETRKVSPTGGIVYDPYESDPKGGGDE